MTRTATTDRTLVSVAAGELPLRLIAPEAMPLYLQIVHQIKQLIMTGELTDGVQLPAVRSLAVHLGINPGTVVQAYQQLASEGLIEAKRGRGSIVRKLSGRTADAVTRERLLDQAVTALVQRSRALGFSELEALQRVSAAFLDTRVSVPVVLVGMFQEQAERFAHVLEERYEGITFRPISLDACRLEGAARLQEEVGEAYTVLTFVTMLPQVERLLDDAGIEAEVIGLRAELTEDCLRRLHALRSADRLAVVTSAHAVSSALAALERVAGIGGDRVEVAPRLEDGALDPAGLRRIAEGDAAIVHTSGVRDEVSALGLPPARLVGLEFELTDASLELLDRKWITGDGEDGE